MKKKSTSQTSQHSWKYAILLAISALALFASSGGRGDDMPFCGEDLFWINPGTGDWFDLQNWEDDFGHHYLPTCHLAVFITNGGTAQISTPTPTASSCQLFLGYNPGQSGNLTVDHGTLNTCHEVTVGSAGKGTLRIQNGGIVMAHYRASIGAIADSSGTVIVNGTNPDGRTSTWTVSGPLYVGGQSSGQGGTGLLTVTNQAGVTADSVHAYKSGTLTGNGTVSTTTTGGTTIEGTLAPNGNGGTFSIGGNLTFISSALMQCNLTPQDLPTNPPQVNVTDTATVNGRLSVTIAAGTPTGQYTLLHASTLVGVFSSYSIKVEGCLGWSIAYDRDNGNVYLDLVATCD